METEPIDLRLPRRPAAVRGPVKKNTVLDGAFASLTHADLRLDEGASPKASEELAPGEQRVSPKLLESLRGQLAEIEAQKRTLQRLLNGLGG